MPAETLPQLRARAQVHMDGGDWEQARTSVERLAALEPELTVTGHGPAMRGPEMRAALHTLARNFTQIAIPENGRYVGAPAND